MTVKMPVPVAWRSKYKSEPGMIGNYPWSYVEHSLRQPALNNYDIESLITTTQAEAYADARVREEQQWHPIETAPKDGTWILAINAAKNPGRQHVVHYSERWGNHYPWTTGSAPMDFVAGVTHWMPLPAPPTE